MWTKILQIRQDLYLAERNSKLGDSVKHTPIKKKMSIRLAPALIPMIINLMILSKTI